MITGRIEQLTTTPPPFATDRITVKQPEYYLLCDNCHARVSNVPFTDKPIIKATVRCNKCAA